MLWAFSPIKHWEYFSRNSTEFTVAHIDTWRHTLGLVSCNHDMWHIIICILIRCNLTLVGLNCFEEAYKYVAIFYHCSILRCNRLLKPPHPKTWWRHQMETFSALLALCAGNSLFTCEFPSQRPVTRSLDVFFDLRLQKRLIKQSRLWWFETPSRSLWRHCNETRTRLFCIINNIILMDWWRKSRKYQ